MEGHHTIIRGPSRMVKAYSSRSDLEQHAGYIRKQLADGVSCLDIANHFGLNPGPNGMYGARRISRFARKLNMIRNTKGKNLPTCKTSLTSKHPGSGAISSKRWKPKTK